MPDIIAWPRAVRRTRRRRRRRTQRGNNQNKHTLTHTHRIGTLFHCTLPTGSFTGLRRHLRFVRRAPSTRIRTRTPACFVGTSLILNTLTRSATSFVYSNGTAPSAHLITHPIRLRSDPVALVGHHFSKGFTLSADDPWGDSLATLCTYVIHVL